MKAYACVYRHVIPSRRERRLTEQVAADLPLLRKYLDRYDEPDCFNDWGERRHLKHRAANEVRQVPISPALGKLLRKHIAEYGTAPDGRLFRGEGGGLLSDTVYGRIWEKARQAALTPAEEASPLAERPYDLRHARLSTWLNVGVAPAQVAEWAGNSVPVLLRVYAKCLTDSEQTALRRLEQAEAEPGDPQAE
jgi:integrase